MKARGYGNRTYVEELVEHFGESLKAMFEQPIDTDARFGLLMQRMREQEESLSDDLSAIAELITEEASNAERNALFASIEAKAIVHTAISDTAEAHAYLWSATVDLLRSCERWGGHPHIRGFPSDPDAIRELWFHRLLYVQPRTPEEALWRRRYLSAFIIAIALRKENTTPEFRELITHRRGSRSHLDVARDYLSSLGFRCTPCVQGA